MSRHEHKERAPSSVGCAVITVSDTRTEQTDESGRLIRELLAAEGHGITHYAIVPDEPERIDAQLDALGANEACRVVLITGGTGIAPRDRTYEAVARRIEKRLDGFGELFRMLSYHEIGPAAMLSRAIGGVWAGRVLFVMPGSPNAVRLAMTRLILPELGHLVEQLGPGLA